MISDILQKADWSRESTFKPFYCRPRLSNSDKYSQRVLQQKGGGGGRWQDTLVPDCFV